MTTLKNLSAQAMRLLSNGPVPRDSKLSDLYIQTEIRQVANKLLRLEYFNALNNGDRDVDPYCIGTYTVDVEEHDDGRNFATLPVMPMILRGRGREDVQGNIGIQQIKPVSSNPDLNHAMIPIMPNEAEIFKPLLVNDEILKDQWTFEPDRYKVWFSERNERTLIEDGIEEVEMKICVLDPNQIGEGDIFPIPPEMEIDILKEILLLHGYQPAAAVDLINDDNPNSR